MRMDEETFAEIVEEALDSIPDGFRGYLRDVAVDIEDMPDEATCEDMNISDPRELLVLYHGTPLTERHVDEPLPLSRADRHLTSRTSNACAGPAGR